MNCFYTRTVRPACRHLASSQTAIIITRSSGFEYIHASKHSFECVDSPDTHRLAASVFFTSPMHLDVGVRLNKADILEPEEEPGQVEVLLDREFPCGHLHLSEKMESPQTVEGVSINRSGGHWLKPSIHQIWLQPAGVIEKLAQLGPSNR